MSLPRPRTLAALGLQRWRLRSRPAAAAAASRAPAAAVVPASAPAGAGPGGAVDALARLTVHAPGLAGPPSEGVAAAVWGQVLAWLAMPEPAVAFAPGPGPGVIDLPPPAHWAGGEGKRALWLALRAAAPGGS